MSWERVISWLDVLRRTEDFGGGPSLSARGTQAAMSAALAGLELSTIETLEQRQGEPYEHAVIVLASTVATAALEWCVVLLGRGTRVTLKVSRRDPGLAHLFATTAQAEGLPLLVTEDRACVLNADLVVAMGQDQTIREIQTYLRPGTRMLGFGHRFSAVWIDREDADDPSTWLDIAFDLALHDSRGCMTPVAVFTDAPTELFWEHAVQAMRETEAAIPRGLVSPIEGALMRSREALARVTGQAMSTERWSVHRIPAELFEPQSLPRSLAIYECQDESEAMLCLGPYKRWLSLVGLSEHAESSQWLAFGAERTCRVGEMQRPPIVRLHNGVDWIRETLKEAW